MLGRLAAYAIALAAMALVIVPLAIGVDWLVHTALYALTPAWRVGIAVASFIVLGYFAGMMSGYDRARKHASQGRLLDWDGRRVIGARDGR